MWIVLFERPGEVLDNGLQEIYVNTKVDDGSDIAKLMHIFTEINAYDFERFPKVSNRKKQFMSSEGGNKEVCDLVEKYVENRVEQDALESARRLFKNGVSYDVVRDSISVLSNEVLEKIYKQVKSTMVEEV